MKKIKVVLGSLVVAIGGFFLVAADHIEAPVVSGGVSDITDFYAFQGENTDNIVFVANVQGLLSPEATANAEFSENTLIEFNIDTDGDAIEDLVIQAIPRDGEMFFFGPSAPAQPGLNSTILTDSNLQASVQITSGQTPVTETANGITYFAGPRDDPFFMDFTQFVAVTTGQAPEFRGPDEAVDTFAGTNVLSVVVEVPKSLIGSTGTINTWVESKGIQ